jgi:flavin-dependent dehydrogenase
MNSLIDTSSARYDVIVVGGGLAGLVTTIALAKAGKHVLLLEKQVYPFHKVCGEYISNEVLPYLQSLGFNPFAYGAANITKLRISSPSGKNIRTGLDLGAFALSRYVVDNELAKLATTLGAVVLTATRVTDVQFGGQQFAVTTQEGDVYTAPFVIGSWGKREKLDKKLNRNFMSMRTSYMAYKMHVRTDYPIDEIGLDNFKGGYTGIVKIEGDKYNICHFYRRPADRSQHSSIRAFEEEVIMKNPVLKARLLASDNLLEAPVVINEISFAAKPPVDGHILMCGDTAGLITPLCGNGMSMAITGAKIVTDLLVQSNLLGRQTVTPEARSKLEAAYRKAWAVKFRQRLFWGRNIQRLFGNPVVTDIALGVMHAIPPLERALIKATHGKPII